MCGPASHQDEYCSSVSNEVGPKARRYFTGYLQWQQFLCSKRWIPTSPDRSDAWVVSHVHASLCCRSLVVIGSRSCCSQCPGTTQKLNAWRGDTRSEWQLSACKCPGPPPHHRAAVELPHAHGCVLHSTPGTGRRTAQHKHMCGQLSRAA
jgi:hypothetical protein